MQLATATSSHDCFTCNPFMFLFLRAAAESMELVERCRVDGRHRLLQSPAILAWVLGLYSLPNMALRRGTRSSSRGRTLPPWRGTKDIYPFESVMLSECPSGQTGCTRYPHASRLARHAPRASRFSRLTPLSLVSRAALHCTLRLPLRLTLYTTEVRPPRRGI
jgi:hypothetical protein